ncbi:aldehyde dehydrogenase, dimeric NADP-preferring-like isoform X2 [Ostrea edulis]|uniref:aldehyde dehydrogenase, dimeric NADP-preferring-like isoform X2 n=1 Tax=Ostrea edulis TaxID=37623 RepID=UPI0024AFB436|nr:aldehyde dehydrogenase, dimeric NADP-preferring-like isoform X2 [Ostrea edulis]
MADYSKLVEGLRRSFKSGVTKSYEWRRKQLEGVLRLLDENRDRIAKCLKEDLNKPTLEATMYEIDYSRNDLVDTMNNLKEWMKPEKVKKGLLNIMDTAYIQREPFGVALVMGAWNYPIQITILPVFGALAAGNCVVLKPSELAASTAQLLEELIPKYLDNDCVKVVNGGIPETTALLKERFEYIFYTGNTTVGKIVMKAAAEYLTPVTLELGGKSPVYVDENSDLSLVARRISWGKLVNCGQTCIAPDYVMCKKDVQDKLVEECKKAMAEYYPDPAKSEDYGRIINERHLHRIKKLIDGSGKLAIGGEVDESQKYIAPTVLTDVKPTDPVMQEEVFGPVLPIMPISSDDEAISFINKGEKPLAMYIFSKNHDVAKKFLNNTSSGSFTFNDTMMQAGLMTLPFGGVGSSGTGAYHGFHTFDTFCHKRAVLERKHGGEGMVAIRYPPYTEKKSNTISWLTRKSPKSGGLWSWLGF